jgi:hypothetical protein
VEIKCNHTHCICLDDLGVLRLFGVCSAQGETAVSIHTRIYKVYIYIHMYIHIHIIYTTGFTYIYTLCACMYAHILGDVQKITSDILSLWRHSDVTKRRHSGVADFTGMYRTHLLIRPYASNAGSFNTNTLGTR